MIRGTTVALRAVEHSDLAQIVTWRNHPEVYRYFFECEPTSLAQQERWFEGLLSRSDEKLFMIVSLDGVSLGTVGLVHIDWRSRKAEWGRFYIGESPRRSSIYGAEAEFLLLDYAFSHLNLNKLYCGTFAFNKSVLSMHKRFGFQVEGTLRRHVFHEGRYEDVVVMGLLRDEFLLRVRRSLIYSGVSVKGVSGLESAISPCRDCCFKPRGGSASLPRDLVVDCKVRSFRGSDTECTPMPRKCVRVPGRQASGSFPSPCICA
jgi:diamine N-acetyltransferase